MQPSITISQTNQYFEKYEMILFSTKLQMKPIPTLDLFLMLQGTMCFRDTYDAI